MRGTRIYPEKRAGPFPTPPVTIDDREGRDIEITTLERDDDELVDALAYMYVLFDPADRAQGIPPTGEDRIRDWLEPIVGDGLNLVAVHDGDVVGHATLVPDVDDRDALETFDGAEWELAIFVLQEYQQAGIGTNLLEYLLGYASDRGVERVWLTVERWNGPAISLYKRVGFELCGTESFEQEMSIRV